MVTKLSWLDEGLRIIAEVGYDGLRIERLTADLGVSKRHDTYNVSSGNPATNREFADALEASTPGRRLDLLPGRQHGPGVDPHLDISRLKQDTGFAPTFDVATAVADYVAWRADNPR